MNIHYCGFSFLYSIFFWFLVLIVKFRCDFFFVYFRRIENITAECNRKFICTLIDYEYESQFGIFHLHSVDALLFSWLTLLCAWLWIATANKTMAMCQLAIQTIVPMLININHTNCFFFFFAFECAVYDLPAQQWWLTQ